MKKISKPNVKYVSEIKDFSSNEHGATSIEYGVLAALVGVSLIGGVQSLGENVSTVYKDVANTIATAGSVPVASPSPVPMPRRRPRRPPRP